VRQDLGVRTTLVLGLAAAVSLGTLIVVVARPAALFDPGHDQYVWCQEHFIADPGNDALLRPATVEETAYRLGLTDPDGGDIVNWWLNEYVRDDAQDWGSSPHPHWDAVYARLAMDPQFARACDAAYATRDQLNYPAFPGP
jgi:hypothetical protein